MNRRPANRSSISFCKASMVHMSCSSTTKETRRDSIPAESTWDSRHADQVDDCAPTTTFAVVHRPKQQARLVDTQSTQDLRMRPAWVNDPLVEMPDHHAA